MQVRTSQAAYPIVGMVGTSIAKHLASRHHSLTEFLRKRGERSFVHSKSAQAWPGKGHRHPSLFCLDGILCLLGRLNRVEDGFKPSPSFYWFVKREEFVTSRERRYTRQKEV